MLNEHWLTSKCYWRHLASLLEWAPHYQRPAGCKACQETVENNDTARSSRPYYVVMRRISAHAHLWLAAAVKQPLTDASSIHPNNQTFYHLLGPFYSVLVLSGILHTNMALDFTILVPWSLQKMHQYGFVRGKESLKCSLPLCVKYRTTTACLYRPENFRYTPVL